MNNFNQIPNSGRFNTLVGMINANFQLTKQKIEELEHGGLEGFCGVFASTQALNTAYPSPRNGQWAYVTTASPWKVYTASNGAWADSGATYNGAIDISGLASQTDLNALDAKVDDLLDDGYQFGGVVTPASSPASSSTVSKWFYIAWTAGDYSTNFGGTSQTMTLESGDLAVIIDNAGTWSINKTGIVAKEFADGYDTEPTEDSEALMKSKDIYTALQALKSEVDDEIADIDMNFASGESVSEVSIASALGQDGNALPTVGAILNEVNVSTLDDIKASALQRGSTPTHYIAYKSIGGVRFKVGVLDVFSNPTGSVLTQVLTTHYVLEGNQISDNVQEDGKVFQYYRSCKINGGTLPTGVGVWTNWKCVNESVWASAIAELRDRMTSFRLISDSYSKSQTDTLLSAKQDTINDLSAIRSGAALGATAIQPTDASEAVITAAEMDEVLGG